jgi:N-acetylglucosamine kinase-like BadF-type ATPase
MALAVDGLIVTRFETGSTNPRSVGGRTALSTFLVGVETLWERRPIGLDQLGSAVLALGAVSTFRDLRHWVDLADRLPGNPEQTLVCNDVLPLFALTAPEAEVVAVICGTGTSFVARGRKGWSRASGLEFILSDEGGAFDIGLKGLRSVIRAADGRGPQTLLSALAADWHSSDPVSLFTHLHHSARPPKQVVASFAPVVLKAVAVGDGVAEKILVEAAHELVIGTLAVARESGVRAPISLLMAGTLLKDDSPLRPIFISALQREAGPLAGITEVDDPLRAVVALACMLRADPTLMSNAVTAVPLQLIAASRSRLYH